MQERYSIMLSRMKWVLFGRLIIAVFALGAVLIHQLPFKEAIFSSPRFLAAYIILTVACFSNIIYLILLKVVRQKLKLIAILQIAIDILLVSSLSYCTGGSASIFVSLYFVLILSANVIVSARIGLLFATISTILLAIITIIYSFSAAGHFKLLLLSTDYVKTTAQGFRFILPYLFFFSLIIHFVAYSVGRLVSALNYERLLKTKILQDMISGIIVLSPGGEILYANPMAQQMLGVNIDLYSSDNRRNKISLHQFLDKAIKLDRTQKEKFLEFSQLFLNRNSIKAGNLPVVIKTLPVNNEDGLLLDVKAAILKSDTNRLDGNVIILDNVTSKRKLEEIYKQSEFLKSLQEMSMSIAHEIRNPLTSIRSAVQELSRQLQANISEDQSKLMEMVIKESERLNNLITNFMDFARERKPTIKRVDIVNIINEIILLIRQINSQEIEIKLDLPKSKLLCDIDSEQIKQVIYNIVLNAICALRPVRDPPERPNGRAGRSPLSDRNNGDTTFRPVASEHNTLKSLNRTTNISNGSSEIIETDGLGTNNVISVKVYLLSNPLPQISGQEAGVMIEIADNGNGIPHQNIQKVFEPFFTTKSDGFGLGLSIAKRIIDNHQGNINIESEMGKGTKISIWLPQNLTKIS
ncbi:MAG: ATP-binding protein [Planctomycetota bacterium]